MISIELRESHKAQTSIFDAAGAVVHRMNINESTLIRKKLSSGLYIVGVSFDSGKPVFRKIVVS